MNISKVLPIDTFEFDKLWKILLEDVAPTLEVELVLIIAGCCARCRNYGFKYKYIANLMIKKIDENT